MRVITLTVGMSCRDQATEVAVAFPVLRQQGQVVNRTLRRVIGEVVSDIRSGSPLSAALMKHPRVFPLMYSRTIAAGERGGNLEVVLRQMAEFIERRILTEKRIKSALTYPDDMQDELHPNQVGFDKMAVVWRGSLSSFLPVCP